MIEITKFVEDDSIRIKQKNLTIWISDGKITVNEVCWGSKEKLEKIKTILDFAQLIAEQGITCTEE